MGLVTALAAGGALISGIGAAVGASAASKEARRAGNAQRAAQAELDRLKRSRQTIINPYESTTDLSGLATDLSDQLSNPFASLGVLRKLLKYKIEQLI